MHSSKPTRTFLKDLTMADLASVWRAYANSVSSVKHRTDCFDSGFKRSESSEADFWNPASATPAQNFAYYRWQVHPYELKIAISLRATMLCREEIADPF